MTADRFRATGVDGTAGHGPVLTPVVVRRVHSDGGHQYWAMAVRELIRCRGHALVSARHPTTFELTAEPHLTPAGDCIIGVSADKGAADLSDEFRAALRTTGAVLRTTLRCGDLDVVIRSEGHPGLALDHPTDLVWRRSEHLCGRTIGIRSDYVARTLPRGLVDLLRSGAPLEAELVVL